MARGMAVEIVLTDSEREELGVRRRATPVVGSCPRAAARAEIVLLAADGLNTSASTAELSQSTQKLNRNFGIGTLAKPPALRRQLPKPNAKFFIARPL